MFLPEQQPCEGARRQRFIEGAAKEVDGCRKASRAGQGEEGMTVGGVGIGMGGEESEGERRRARASRENRESSGARNRKTGRSGRDCEEAALTNWPHLWRNTPARLPNYILARPLVAVPPLLGDSARPFKAGLTEWTRQVSQRAVAFFY